MRLRTACAADAEALHELSRVLVQDGRGMVLDSDEVGLVDATRARVERFVSDGDCYLLAEDDSGLLGCVDIARIQRRRLVHNGLLTMGVHPRAQGRGVGRALIEASLAWAEANGVERVELYTLSSNERAQRLYESVGFRLAWTREGFHRRPDGTLEADLVWEWRAG